MRTPAPLQCRLVVSIYHFLAQTNCWYVFFFLKNKNSCSPRLQLRRKARSRYRNCRRCHGRNCHRRRHTRRSSSISPKYDKLLSPRFQHLFLRFALLFEQQTLLLGAAQVKQMTLRRKFALERLEIDVTVEELARARVAVLFDLGRELGERIDEIRHLQLLHHLLLLLHLRLQLLFFARQFGF
jgi:hypothetical protein